MTARAIFVGGTTSHAGKSWMATAICAWLRRRGVRVAPFKSQNMSNNSYPCAGGGEIGRAQVAQAEACGLEPQPDMNPILLKPDSDSSSQVVLNGKVWRTLDARAYYEHHAELREHAYAAYHRLAARFDVMVIEGAGSVAELNLIPRDLVNLPFAKAVGARAMLVADIDRGGVFAQILGTLCILPDADRALIRSFAVNRFRGDRSLFNDGVRILEERGGIPSLGVFPYAEIPLDDEDAVSIDGGDADSAVAVVQFPRISNATDFRVLRPRYVRRPAARDFDVVILPGTKNTLADLGWMRERGLDRWVIEQQAAGAIVLGICGGYQMLGRSIDGVAGLALLPVDTTMRETKTTAAVRAVTPGGAEFGAYEIHMGDTPRPSDCAPFAFINGEPEGARAGRVLGTYLHGSLDSPAVVRELLGIEVEAKPEVYPRLADWFEQYADTRLFEEIYL